MKFNLPLNNFTSGAWSPKMLSRTDTDQYTKACATLKNFLSQVHGGAQYRGAFAALDIVSSTLQDEYDTMLTNPVTNDFKLIPYNTYNPAYSTVLCVSKTTSQFHMLPSGAAPNLPLVFFAPWIPSAIQFVQLGDYLVIADGTGANDPHVFFYNTGIGQYQLSPLTSLTGGKAWKAAPWEPLIATDNTRTMTVTGTMTVGGSVTITAAAAGTFIAGETGHFMRFCNSTKRAGVVLITGFTSGTVVTGTVYQVMPKASGFVYASEINTTSFWQRHAWSQTKGFPRTVTTFQGRLIFGGSKTYPDTVWGSRISDFFNFEEIPEPNTSGISGFASSAFTSDNTRSFALTPNSPEASNIVALSSAKTLTVHTEKSEIVCYGSKGALGPTDVVFDSSTSFGARAVQPVRVNNFSTFVQAAGKRIRDIIYSFNEDQFKSTDLNFVADHLLLDENGGYTNVDELVRLEGRSSYLCAKTDYGKLLICTLDRDYQVNAWMEVELGGNTGNTAPYLLSMCSFNNSLYALIMRYVDNTAHVSLEVMSEPWEYKNSANNILLELAAGRPKFLDQYYAGTGLNPDGDSKSSQWSVDGTNVNWFKNMEVSVVADGNYIGEVTVDADGEFTLTKFYKHVAVGFIYEGLIVSLPIEAGSQYGSAAGRIKRIDEVVIKMLNSCGLEVGIPDGIMDEIPIRQSGQPMNEAVHYFSGDKVINFPASYNRAAQVAVRQRKPYPAYVVSITPRGQTYEG